MFQSQTRGERVSYQRAGLSDHPGRSIPMIPARTERRGLFIMPPVPPTTPAGIIWAPTGSGYRRATPTRGVRGLGFDYSAITDCSMLTPYQQSQAPQCGGSAAPVGPGVYVAPTLTAALSCVDPASGFALTDAACVNQNLAIQASNQSLLDAANRAVFLKNCHDMIANENLSRASRGLPLQVDDCDQRTFGQVAPGTTGSPTYTGPAPSYYTPTPAPVPATSAPASAAGPVAVSAPAPASAAPAGTTTGDGGYVPASAAPGIMPDGFDLGAAMTKITSGSIPWWVYAGLGVGAIVLFSGGRR